jgi:hypothetical protein
MTPPASSQRSSTAVLTPDICTSLYGQYFLTAGSAHIGDNVPLSGIIIGHPTTLSTRMLFSSGCTAPKWRSRTEEDHQISVPSPQTPRSPGDESARSSHLAPLPPLSACFPVGQRPGPAGETASEKQKKKKQNVELSSSHPATIRICELGRPDRQAPATVQPQSGTVSHSCPVADENKRGVVSWCGFGTSKEYNVNR